MISVAIDIIANIFNLLLFFSLRKQQIGQSIIVMQDNIILTRITEKPIESSKATTPGAANITRQKAQQTISIAERIFVIFLNMFI